MDTLDKICENNDRQQLMLLKQKYLNVHRLILDTPFTSKNIVSYGLIVYAKDTKRWAIVQRKHSVEFLLFIRGLYRLTHLPFLLKCITVEEAKIIHKCLNEDPSTFTKIFLYDLKIEEAGLNYALIRMAECRHIVLKLLSHLDLSKNTLKWTWPKGRLLYNYGLVTERETPFACAKREFEEEVEINLPNPLFISNTYVGETIHTITGKNIESKYWIYIVTNEIPMTEVNNHPEVSNRLWVSTETCLSLMNETELFAHILEIMKNVL